MRHNLAALDGFPVVLKGMNHIGLWDFELVWYSLVVWQRKTTMLMNENIICFFSFPFITWNVRMVRVRKRQRQSWCTHTRATVWFFCETSLPFCFVLPWLKSYLVYIIFQMLTQILMVMLPTYTLHLDTSFGMPPTQFMSYFHWRTTCILFTLRKMYTSCYATHTTYVAFSLGNNLCPAYFRKHMHLQLCHPHNLSSMSKRSFNQYPTPWVLLNRFVSMALSTNSESAGLDQLDLVWLSRFLQFEQNFINHLVTVLWFTAPSPFIKQLLLVALVMLWLSLNSLSISSWIWLHYIFICTTFKSYMEWSNAQHANTPTVMILPTTMSTFHGLNYFVHIYVLYIDL